MGLYLRLIDSCFTQLKAQGPSSTCNESKEVVVSGTLPSASISLSDSLTDVIRVEVWSIMSSSSSCRGKTLFINSQTRPLHASERDTLTARHHPEGRYYPMTRHALYKQLPTPRGALFDDSGIRVQHLIGSLYCLIRLQHPAATSSSRYRSGEA